MAVELDNKQIIDLTAQYHFQFCIAELIKAKEKMTDDAVLSQDPKRIKSALILLLDGNKTLITALDVAYKKLHEARMSIHSKND